MVSENNCVVALLSFRRRVIKEEERKYHKVSSKAPNDT